MLWILNNNKINDLIWYRKKNWTLKIKKYDKYCNFNKALKNKINFSKIRLT